MSLTELLVAMVITAIALTIVGNFFVAVVETTAVTRTTRVATGTAANALDELGRVIRVAADNPTSASGVADPGIVAGTANSLTVISYIDTDPMASAPVPSMVAFAVDGRGNLIETRTAGVKQVSGYWAFTGPVTTRTIPGPISTTGTMFAYTADDGTPVVPGTGGLTLAQRQSIETVTITVTVPNAGRAGSDPVQLTTAATMINLSLS